MERPTFRIKVKLDASDAGRWFLVQEKWSWADFRSSLSAKLGRTVAKVCDQDGGEFDDVSLLRENDIVLVTEAQNANSLSTPLSAHTPTPAALEKTVTTPTAPVPIPLHVSPREESPPTKVSPPARCPVVHVSSDGALPASPAVVAAALSDTVEASATSPEESQEKVPSYKRSTSFDKKSKGDGAGRRDPPGPPPRLLVGNLLDLMPSVVPASRRLAKQYGGIVKLTLFGKSLFVITEPKYLQPVLDLQNKRLPPQELASEGLFLADGDKWKFARSTLSPYFTAKYVNNYISMFDNKANELIAEIDKAKDEPIDVMEAITKYSFEAICKAGFSHEAKLLEKGIASEDEPPFCQAFTYCFEKQKSRVFRLQFFNKIPTWGNIKFWNALDRLHSSVDDLIDESERHSNKKDNERVDLLSLMMKAKHPDTGETLDRKNLRDQAITLLVAGHKTVQLLTSWFMYLLSQNPDVETKVVDELFEILGDDPSAIPTPDQIKNLRYLEQCLRETLRMFPPAQSNIRGTDEEMNVGGYYIPANSNFLVNVVGVHYSPDYWESPEKFNPDRFTPENMAKMHPYQWIPFGGGPRTCVGMLFALTESKVVLSKLLRTYSIKMDPGKKLVLGANPLKPLHGLYMNFTKLDKPTPVNGSPSTVKAASKSEKRNMLKTASRAVVTVPVSEIPPEQWPTLFKGIQVPVLILYGTNQGTSKQYALQLANELEKNNFVPEVAACDEYRFEDIPRNPILIVVTATYNGYLYKAPDNAVKFIDWMNRKDHKEHLLDGLRFGVFGVGNSNWHTTFQRVPRALYQRLLDLGGDSLLELGEGDEDKDMEAHFGAWKTMLVSVLCDEFARAPTTVLPPGQALPPQAIPKPHFIARLDVAPTSETEKKKKKDVSLVSRQYKRFKVLVNNELTDKAGRSTRHIELKVPRSKSSEQSDGALYTAGDHLAIFPENNAAAVKAAANALGVSLDSYFVLTPASLKSSMKPPLWSKAPVSVQKYLTQIPDLSCHPTRQQLEVLSYYAADQAESENLRFLSTTVEDAVQLYATTIVGNRMNIIDVLTTFKSLKVPFGLFIELATPIKPRFYSISSSPAVYPAAVHVTIGVQQWEASIGVERQSRQGLCSGYVAGVKANSRIYCAIKPCPTFRLPKVIMSTDTTPIICVGAGTGVAPFRGFLQERAASGSTAKDTLLFFGCRNNDEFLYAQEFSELNDSGRISLHVALSREGPTKVYVQDKVFEHRSQVYDLVANKNAIFYICGDGKYMAKDVYSAMLKLVVMEGSLSEEDAMKFIERLQKEGRYVQDVWG